MEIDTNKIYWISPNDIQHHLVTPGQFFVDLKNWGVLSTDDWDQRVGNFEDFILPLRDLLFENIPFADTSYGKLVISDYKLWGYNSPNEALEKEVRVRQLCNNICEFGYLTQEEVANLPESGKKCWVQNSDGLFHDEITVVIDRYGKLVLTTGFHRLTISKLLGLNKIPIKVRSYHKIWFDFVNHTYRLCEKWWGKNSVYQPIPHISFEHLVPQWSNKRFEIIENHLISKQGTVLDAGSLFGAASHYFDGIGFQLTAVEMMPEFYQAMNIFKLAKCKDFQTILGDLRDIKERKYNVVLFLNILHHLIKDEIAFKRLESYLKTLSVTEIFFQTPELADHQMKEVYFKVSPRKFAEFVGQATSLSNITCIYRENNRPLFHIWGKT